ncbi:MAG: D-alanyl-D-alanine carboxypeptidase, partial [Halocynthiibacter sp.]
LVGGGDPTLTTDVLGDMARDLKAAGVNEITGRFRVYSAALPYVRAIDDEQADHLGYNPAISGLNLNFNRVYFEWKRASGGYEVTMDARARRFRPQVSLTRMRIVDRETPVYAYSQAQGRENWSVARSALGNSGGRWLPVRKPDAYAGEVFRTLARSHGIVLRPAGAIALPPQGTVVVENFSSELRLILRDMLRYSTNLTAEVVGLSASAAGGRRVRSLRASSLQMQNWFGESLGGRNARFRDHSGLGDGSLLSANEMLHALVQVGPDGPLRRIMKEIKLVGDDGRPLPRQPMEIRAKTGTLNFVSALSGYLRSPGGRDLAFAMFLADPERRARLSEAERERPPGGRAWTRRARALQQQLLLRWGSVYEI